VRAESDLEMKGSCVIVMLATLLHGCDRTHDSTYPIVRLPPSCAQRRIQLAIVGDSLARGWGASAPQHTFASLVYSSVRHQYPRTTLHNLGIPGATTDRIAAGEVSRIRKDDCTLVVIVSGANDVQKLYTPHHFRTSYGELLKSVRSRLPDAGVVVIGLPDVSLSPRIIWPFKPIESWLSRDGSASIAREARTYGAAFVPLYALSRKEAYRSKSLLSGDGIHPNDEGYRIMARAALPSITMLLPRLVSETPLVFSFRTER
jgi:lysophospholipase L1-like esterase